jgi:hypothetical protein
VTVPAGDLEWQRKAALDTLAGSGLYPVAVSTWGAQGWPAADLFNRFFLGRRCAGGCDRPRANAVCAGRACALRDRRRLGGGELGGDRRGAVGSDRASLRLGAGRGRPSRRGARQRAGVGAAVRVPLVLRRGRSRWPRGADATHVLVAAAPRRAAASVDERGRQRERRRRSHANRPLEAEWRSSTLSLVSTLPSSDRSLSRRLRARSRCARGGR